MKKIALFLPLRKGHILEMLPVAKGLEQKDKLEPVFCLESKAIQYAELIAKQGFRVINTKGVALKQTQPAKTSAAQPTAKKQGWKSHVYRFLPSLLREMLSLRVPIHHAKALLDTLPVQIILTVGDRHIGIETALIAEASRRNIPSLIVPFAMSFPEASAEPRLREYGVEKYEVRSLGRWILRLLFPSWVFVYKNIPLFFHPPANALAAWLLGIAPRYPWTLGGGHATRMAVESDALRDLLASQGTPRQKMVVTGKPALDETGTATQVAQKADRDMILCSVPQLAEHDLLTWEEHKEEMQFLFRALVDTGARVVLSLHPKSNRTWYQPLADEAGVEIADKRIYQLLPTCTVFVATYSSTIAQAMTLHKPSIVIDFYDLLYPIYDNVPGISVLRNREEFAPQLKRLLEDNAFYEECVAKLRKEGPRWALLDGKNTQRVLNLIDELL